MPDLTTTDAAESTRYVFAARIRCPVCSSADLKPLRSIDQGDGTRMRRTLCRECDHRFFVILK